MNNKEFKIYKVNDDSFVGIKFENDVIGLYIPSLYNIGLKENVIEWQDIKWEDISGGKIVFKENVLRLLKSISIANTREFQTGKAYVKLAQANKAFESMLWLIDDCIKNGIYCEFGKKQSLNSSGRINWKKTIKQVPYINQKDEFIYNSIIVDKKVKVHKILTDIYKYCLQMSINTLGWLWDINFSIAKISKSIPQLYYCNVLKKEMQTTFLDSKKERLEHLLNVLQGVDEKDCTSFSYGVKSYHTVFEKMIDKMFGTVSDKDKSLYYPNAKWHFANNNTKEASKLRPDTIMVLEKGCGKEYYILDAKYYDTKVCVYDNYPSSSDIQKQITYGNYLEKKLKESSKENLNEKNTSMIYNAFILPCDIANYRDNIVSSTEDDNGEKRRGEEKEFKDNVVYLGYAEADWVEGEKSYEKIIGLYIDLKYLINNYQNKTHIKGLSEIIEDKFRKIPLI